MNEWQVVLNYVGHTIYQVVRIKDKSKPMYAGNLEYRGGIFESCKDAEEYATKLNVEQIEK